MDLFVYRIAAKTADHRLPAAFWRTFFEHCFDLAHVRFETSQSCFPVDQLTVLHIAPPDTAITVGIDACIVAPAIHRVNCASASCRPVTNASPSLPGSLPPAWAMLGRPPPPPPTSLATSPTSLPACTPFWTRSSVAAASRPTLSSFTQPTRTSALPAFCLMRSTWLRNCSSGPAG